MSNWIAGVSEARDGDLAAFDAVVRRFQDMAVGYAYSILGDFPLAEDAAQEAFIQAYLNLKALREAQAFPAWLRRIVLTQCNRLTRRKRLATVPLDDTGELADPGPNLLAAVHARELRDGVLAAVNALPEHERAATALFYIDGYSLAEVGEFLEVPVSTVKNRLYSARAHLKERMEGMVEEAIKRHAPGDEFTRRIRWVLDGITQIPWESTWLCFEGSLHACLRHQGEQASLAFVMGVSGGAFNFLWHADSSPEMYNLALLGEEPVRRTMAALGRTYTYIPLFRAPGRVVLKDRATMAYDAIMHARGFRPEDRRHTRERCRSLIVASIDAGRPVVALGVLGPPAGCVITGYDKGGDVLYGRSYFQPSDEGYFRSDAWYENCEGLVILGEKGAPLGRRETLAAALEWALDLARTPRRDTVVSTRHHGATWHHSGLAAYEPLANEFLRDERFTDDPAVLSPSIERTMYDGVWFLLETRRQAGLFLIEFLSEGHPGEEALQSAAAAYADEADTLRQAESLVPMEASEKCLVIADPAIRRELRRIVLQARGHEERAVAHLEAAYRALRRDPSGHQRQVASGRSREEAPARGRQSTSHPRSRRSEKERGADMSGSEQAAVFVRIIELPPVRMARSGRGNLDAFDKWWSSIAAQQRDILFPQDFMWFNPELSDFEWLYVLPEGVEDTGGYEVFDFPGGLYAVAACRDEGEDIGTTNQLIHQWIAQSEVFAEVPGDGADARYDMGHVITPRDVKETLGYHQMDLFVPIVHKKR
jgi:RNA polymerase sigma factor (sigma-70 family)